MLSNVAWAKPVIQPATNSLSEAALEINAKHAPPQTNMKPAKMHTHESEKYNSLSGAALAIQEAHMKRDPKTETTSSPNRTNSQRQNSFYGAVLEKQFSRFK
tara:strand:+ start:59983 stop:60288 length:306 start_codon:yes stop_codon:yes gene_type:complete